MKTMKLFAAITLAAICYGFVHIPAIKKIRAKNASANYISNADLKTTMRKLWEDHVTWTRNVIFNIMDDLPGTDQAVKRLLRNQDDIGNAISHFMARQRETS